MKNLKQELDFIQLEDRLEMVNLAQAESSEAACATQNTGCGNGGSK